MQQKFHSAQNEKGQVNKKEPAQRLPRAAKAIRTGRSKSPNNSTAEREKD